MQSDMQHLSTSLAVGGSDLDDHMNDMAGVGWELVTMAVEHATGDDLPVNAFHPIWRRQFDLRYATLREANPAAALAEHLAQGASSAVGG